MGRRARSSSHLRRPPLRLLPREPLPPAHRNAHAGGADLPPEAPPARHLRRAARRAGAEEWVVDVIVLAAVVADRSGHALDGLLRRVHRLLVLRLAVDVPHRRLFSVAAPPRRAALPHGVPAGLM